MKKKLFTLSIVSFAILAFALVMLFIPFGGVDKDEVEMFSASFVFSADELEDLFDDPLVMMFLFYPVSLIVSTLLVTLANLNHMKASKEEGVPTYRKSYTNLVATFLFGLLAWGISIAMFLEYDNFAIGAFVYSPLVYLVPSIALLIINSKIKDTYRLLKKEAKKAAKAAKAAAEAAAAETETAAEEK